MFKKKIFIAGHQGMVGSAIMRQLKKQDIEIITKTRKELNLLNHQDVHNFFKNKKIDEIYLAAAKVGGIYANNTYPADFIYQNLMIQNNVIHSAFLNGVKKLLFLGSSCIYPKNCKQPIKENYLLTGKLEETNEPYAVAKIAGIKMCESYNIQFNTNYKCLMPTNTFGPNDNYDPLKSHFFPSLIRKVHEIKVKNRKELTIWGDGSPKREVIYVDDIADACLHFMNKKFKETIINIGTGKDFSIKQYAKIILNLIIPKKNIKIKYDKSKPNGTPRKVMNVSLAKKYGWKSKKNLKEAIKLTYSDYLLKKL